ncbi:MAG: YceI family protein [Flavobacteriaceae bacterium]|nr:YceI family protein [Flavobacteriaceae bacterium]
MIKKILVSAVIVLGLFSCKCDKKKTEANTKYEVVKGSESLKWTAYKTTSKVGVSGTFDVFSFEYPNKEITGDSLVDNIKFAIDLTSVNSNNPDRDKKLKESFFGLFEGQKVEGVVIQKDKTISMTMNGITMNQNFDFRIEDQENGDKKVVSTIQIDLGYWKALSALESLAEVCNGLHKGEDGISKTWEQVDVEVSYIVKKTN